MQMMQSRWFFLWFSKFSIFFLVFSMQIGMYNARLNGKTSNKHDQILGYLPQLKSHSLCVVKMREIPKRKLKCKEKLVYTREGDGVPSMGSEWRQMPRPRRRLVGMWCSSLLVLSFGLQTVGGSQPHLSRSHHRRKQERVICCLRWRGGWVDSCSFAGAV